MASHKFWSLFAMTNLRRGGVPLSVTFISWSRNMNQSYINIFMKRAVVPRMEIFVPVYMRARARKHVRTHPSGSFFLDIF